MLAALLGPVGPAHADWPERPITVVVMYSPGGGTDHARLASIHARKTAALFRAAIAGGAALAGAREWQLEALDG